METWNAPANAARRIELCVRLADDPGDTPAYFSLPRPPLVIAGAVNRRSRDPLLGSR